MPRIVRAYLIALSILVVPSVAAACDEVALAADQAAWARLTALRRFNASAVSAEALADASRRYVLSAEACFPHGGIDAQIDDGGVYLDDDHLGTFALYGNKWGGSTPYNATGADNTGPHLSGGIVTYSFMANGVNATTEPGDVSGSILALSSLPTYEPCFLTEITEAFATWSAVANIQFAQVADNGLAFNALGATGDIRIGAHVFDGLSSALAHGYYPPPNGSSAAGDIHFDQAERWSCAPGTGLVDIGFIALHEIGHAIGLLHETRAKRVAVMNPFYNAAIGSVLLGDDVDGATNIYGSSTGATDDLVITFGAGLWRYDYGRAWTPIHGLSPEAVVPADLDGTGIEDLIVDFGSGLGLFVYLNHTSWFQLHNLSPTQMAVGDIDGNGLDDVAFSFAGLGLYLWTNSATWTHLHTVAPNVMAVGNIDGINGEDLILNFPGFGVWTFRNNAVWAQLHSLDASLIATAHIDTAQTTHTSLRTQGQDDIILAFPGYGLYQYSNNATWSFLEWHVPERIAVGDLDTDGRDDLVIDFGKAAGVWTYRNGGTFTWSQLHSATSEGLAMGDLDGNGQDEIVIDFGPDYGVWLRVNDTSWLKLHDWSPEGVSVVDFN